MNDYFSFGLLKGSQNRSTTCACWIDEYIGPTDAAWNTTRRTCSTCTAAASFATWITGITWSTGIALIAGITWIAWITGIAGITWALITWAARW